MGGKACRHGGQDFCAAQSSGRGRTQRAQRARGPPIITVRVDGQRVQAHTGQSARNLLARLPVRGAMQVPDALEFAGQALHPDMTLADAGINEDAQLSVVYRHDPARCRHPRLQFGHASPEGYLLLCPDCGIEPSVAFTAPAHGDVPVVEFESREARRAKELWLPQPKELCCHPFSYPHDHGRCTKCGKSNAETAARLKAAMTEWKYGPGLAQYTRRVGRGKVEQQMNGRRLEAQRAQQHRRAELSRKHIWE